MISLHQKRFQQQAILFQRKMAAAMAFITTMFFLWIEEVKAFSTTHSIFNKNVLLFLASGAHSLTNKWRNTGGAVFREKRAFVGSNMNQESSSSASQTVPLSRMFSSRSFTSLKMAWSLPSPAFTSLSPSEWKTPFSSLGGTWYNKVEPVSFSPMYDDDGSDYTFSSPVDYWPSSTSLADMDTPSETEVVPRRHIRLFRKVAGWLTRGPSTQRPVARLETAGSQASFF